MKFAEKFLLIGWFFLSFLLLLYSFTQVDLSLTLSRISIWQDIQKGFQYIGYFQRPLSTLLYLKIILAMFLLYCLTLQLVRVVKIDRNHIWKIIIVVSVILFFSYNAFSYDFFNYIFDAKISTHYHENPYQHRATDYLSDPMLSFMRSTHRTYPYGPVWLGLTIPLSFAGFQIFLFTFYLFKALTVVSYLGSVYFLEKILNKLNTKNIMLGIVFFALNPLVLIESLVSGHNDIVMVFFALAGFYFLLQRKYLFSFILLLLSIGIKFTTIFLLPIFVLVLILQLTGKKIEKEKISILSVIFMTLAVIAMSASAGPKTPEPQPWYLLNLIPFVALVLNKKIIAVLTLCLSVGLMFFYVPYLYLGEWPKNIIEIKLWIVAASLILGVGLYSLISKNSSSKNISNSL